MIFGMTETLSSQVVAIPMASLGMPDEFTRQRVPED